MSGRIERDALEDHARSIRRKALDASLRMSGKCLRCPPHAGENVKHRKHPARKPKNKQRSRAMPTGARP